MKASVTHAERGTSLTEVLIATSLLVVVLGAAMGGHLALIRMERTAGQREQATLIAASAAEAMREPANAAEALAHWRRYAARLLPDAALAIEEVGHGVAAAVVSWRTASNTAAPSEVLPQRCFHLATMGGHGDHGDHGGRACVAALFVR